LLILFLVFTMAIAPAPVVAKPEFKPVFEAPKPVFERRAFGEGVAVAGCADMFIAGLGLGFVLGFLIAYLIFKPSATQQTTASYVWQGMPR
jgi:hypothetical protein